MSPIATATPSRVEMGGRTLPPLLFPTSTSALSARKASARSPGPSLDRAAPYARKECSRGHAAPSRPLGRTARTHGKGARKHSTSPPIPPFPIRAEGVRTTRAAPPLRIVPGFSPPPPPLLSASPRSSGKGACEGKPLRCPSPCHPRPLPFPLSAPPRSCGRDALGHTAPLSCPRATPFARKGAHSQHAAPRPSSPLGPYPSPMSAPPHSRGMGTCEGKPLGGADRARGEGATVPFPRSLFARKGAHEGKPSPPDHASHRRARGLPARALTALARFRAP
ncbi:hypothetical protein EDB83DRAFT_2517665 [Lactarius deliciosus]|nr:hypothetical protein EDB83DRAFT_2517665 [Lactarius deliciosus]